MNNYLLILIFRCTCIPFTFFKLNNFHETRCNKASCRISILRKLMSLSQIRFPLHPVCDRGSAGKRREGDYCRYRASVLRYVLGSVLSVLRYIHGDTAILCTDRHARRTPDCLIDCLNTLRAPVPRTQTRTTAFCIDAPFSLHAKLGGYTMLPKMRRIRRRRERDYRSRASLKSRGSTLRRT